MAETEVCVRQLEQEDSGHTEGESDLKWMCQPAWISNIKKCSSLVAHDFPQSVRYVFSRSGLQPLDIKYILPIYLAHFVAVFHDFL